MREEKKREKEGEEREKGRENKRGRYRKREDREYYRYLSSEMVLLSISMAVKSNIVVAFLNWVVSSSREGNISTPHDANDLTHMNCVSIVSAAKHITRGEKQEEREVKHIILVTCRSSSTLILECRYMKGKTFFKYQMHKKCG